MSSSSEREFRDWNSRTLTADPQNWWHLLEYERKLAWDAAYAAATEAGAARETALRVLLNRICESVVSVIREEDGDENNLIHNLPESWQQALGAHAENCNDADDITCRRQNCGMLVAAAIREGE